MASDLLDDAYSQRFRSCSVFSTSEEEYENTTQGLEMLQLVGWLCCLFQIP